MAQTIPIDSTFTADGEIFPFGQVDTIYGLSISGSVQLLSDTSLVRVILTDSAGNEWMVYEAYPMIVGETSFDFENECDETCYLFDYLPYSVHIQIIDAIFHADSIHYSTSRDGDLSNLQYQSKRDKDVQKLFMMNYNIVSKGWDWIAGDNNLLSKYYNIKTTLFKSKKYNLQGFDYYIQGCFQYSGGNPITNTGSIYPSTFDWRSKHNADVEDTPYFNANGLGWITDFSDQGDCGACWVFGPVASLEALANLYFNQHINYNLSEQKVLCCAYANPQHNVCEGGELNKSMIYLRNNGVHDENCYIYTQQFWTNCCVTCPDNPPQYRIKSSGHQVLAPYYFNTVDSIKHRLINKGPLPFSIRSSSLNIWHVMSLIGYYVTDQNKICWVFKDSDDGGYGGFWNIVINQGDIDQIFSFKSEVIIEEGTLYNVQIRDEDHDGYYNWGIGPRPEGVPNDYQQDSNDNDNRTGPYNANYYGIPVAPEIEVYYNIFQPSTVKNQGIVNVTGNNSNNNSYTFVIKNPGTAQLNLKRYQLKDKGKVTIEYQNENGTFDINEDDLPDMAVCMDNCSTQFKITLYQEAEPGALAHIRIHLNEFDMDDFYFTIIYNGCDAEEGEEEIDGTVTWSDPFRIQFKDVRIKRLAELTITETVFFPENVDIFVEAGGKLIIDGGKLTSSCGTLWNGIDVWGDPDMPQSGHYQGIVSMINGGCIEYAVRGIETTRHHDDRRWYPSGAIISCQNALFKDNLIDIYFFPYTNRHPVTQDILPNFSRFSKTTFITTDDLYDIMALAPSSRIFMDEVGGIVFSGCTFGNYSTRNDRYRGKGIESHGSGYYITSDCLYQVHPCSVPIPSRFENFDYGIRAFNNNGYFTVTVDSAEFHHNRRGAHFRLMGYPAVIKSTFDITDPEGLWTQDEMVGLYLDAHTTGFKIEENQFFGSSPSTNIGMHLLNTGTVQNEIYNNSFTSLLTGIVAAGENRLGNTGAGLCIKCNDFRECTTDVFVTYEEDEYGNPIITENTGIALKQGDEGNDNTSAAGNTFSGNAENNYLNDDGCKHIDYTYHGDNPPDNIIPSNYAGEFTPLSDDDAYYSKSGSCPSHLGGGINPSMESFNLSIETSMISAYQDTLQLLVDGGNTEALNYEVISSYPQEALVVRQNLLNSSPYLSDTVMISAIEKEEVLPNAMIRDILVANPQALKSHVVMNALEQRQAPVPEYMVAEIMQGTAIYGAKELLEQQLGRHIAARDEAWGKLNQFYRNDTVNPSSYDSLVFLLENENRLTIKYDLAFLYLERQDSSGVFALLENMPSGFYLSERELMVHGLYAGLFELLWGLKSDSGSLDSTKLTILSGMASHYPVIPAVYAANMLIKAGVWLYEEPVYLPNPLKTKPIGASAPGEQIRAGHLKVFPNPAGTYVIAEYDLGGLEPPFSITLTNLQGIDLKTIPVKDRLNQIIIPTMDYPQGVYLIRLLAGKSVVDSKKITIIR
ncbi:MAG: T9SS type A sorting domain-containing protein [Bacteroidales bacterium]|nr:T9SS type A sorting domain-containing protein [Bacteroidales bacterium]